MAKLKNIKISSFFVAMIMFFSVFLLVGCGGGYTITTTVTGSKVGYSVYEEENMVKKGEPASIAIQAEPGYRLDGVVVRVNGSIVNGVVYGEFGDNIVNDGTGIDQFRQWTYNIEKVTSNIKVEIDLTNCGIVQRTIMLSGLSHHNPHYSIGVGEGISEATEFNSDFVTNPTRVEGSKITVDYGKEVFLFLNNDIFLTNSKTDSSIRPNSLSKYGYNSNEGGVSYKYNGQYAYYLDKVTKNATISEYVYPQDSYFGSPLANTFDIRFVQRAYYSSASLLANVVNIAYHGSSHENDALTSLQGNNNYICTLLYLGDEVDPKSDEVFDEYRDGWSEYLNILGDKAYYKVTLNEDWYKDDESIDDIVKFYLVANMFEDVANKTPLELKTYGDSHYIEVNRADINAFVEAGITLAFLKTIITEAELAENYVGFELNYTNNDQNNMIGIDMGVDEYGTSIYFPLEQNYVSYIDYREDGRMVYYYHKDIITIDDDSDKKILKDIIVKIGNGSGDSQNYSNPYIKEFAITIRDPKQYDNDDIVFDTHGNYGEDKSTFTDEIVIKETNIEILDDAPNYFKITINTQFQQKDTTIHAIDFSDLIENYQFIVQGVYVTDNPDSGNWVAVLPNNLDALNALGVSSENPLYFYSKNDSFFSYNPKLIIVEIEDDVEREIKISDCDIYYSITGSPLNISLGDDYRPIGVLYISNGYIPANQTLIIDTE